MTSINDFFHQFPVKKCPKNHHVLEPGAGLDYLYFIDSGQVRMYSLSASGQESTLHIFQPQSFFPIMLVLAHTPNPYYFQTLTPCQLRSIPAQKLLDFLKSHPDQQLALLERLSQGMVGLLKRIENLTTLPAQAQLNSLLTHLNTRAAHPITHQDLANWLGLSRETVTRLHTKSKSRN